MNHNTLLTRLKGVDVLSWNPSLVADDSGHGRLVNNFGDLLGPLLVERVLSESDVSQSSLTTPPTLVTVGSIMHFAPPGAVVWGTGVNFKLARRLPPHLNSLDVRSVRGPYSARAITAAGGRVPEVFGDPALLLPRYMPELTAWNRTGKGSVVVVPNLNDYDVLSAEASQKGISVVDPRWPLADVLRTIAESGFVIGSSLHAIVLADAMGIPARAVLSPSEGPFKYRDYFAGTGRPATVIASDFDSAIELGGHGELQFDSEALLAQFPFDLWERPQSPLTPATPFADQPSVSAAWASITGDPRLDFTPFEQRFVDDLFPALLAAGRLVVASGNEAQDAAAIAGFADAFSEARDFRLALAVGAERSDPSADSHDLVDELDQGNSARFLRALWLIGEGPHALVRDVTREKNLRVISLVLRPGRLENKITSIDVVSQGQSGQVHTVSAPVFNMYRRQWSIDVCVSIETDFSIESLAVRTTDESGFVSEVAVREAPRERITLWGYPTLKDLPQWREHGYSSIDMQSGMSAG